MKKPTLFLAGIFCLFFLTRAYIWFHGPPEFTEIIYSYMPYAHLWASGVKPYLEQWYEYPPATIPLFYLPHLIDRTTHAFWWHIDYGIAYRGQILLIDSALFGFLWFASKKLFRDWRRHAAALLYYIVVTTLANHFLYDTMDLVFAAAMTVSAAAAVWPGYAASFVGWIGFWLAAALKLMNAPLGPLFLLQDVDRARLRRALPSALVPLFISALAAAVVWGLPLLLYRSSLQVMLLFHNLRGLQVDTAGAILVRTINAFTQTETVIEVYKNYEMAGPYSTQVLSVLKWLFPASILTFLAYWAQKIGWSPLANHTEKIQQRVHIAYGFVLLMMITGKVLSRPFMLWHIPLLALWTRRGRAPVWHYAASLVLVFLTLQPIPDVPVGIFRTALLVGVVRTLLFIGMMLDWYWESVRKK